MSNTPIVPELRNEWPDLAKVKDEILALYQRETHDAISTPNATEEETRAILAWLNRLAMTSSLHTVRRRNVLLPVFSPTLSAKAIALSQYLCPICSTNEGLSPPATLSIRIRPESKQAIAQRRGKRAAFERAIADRFKDYKNAIDSDQSICLLITFVVKRSGVQKDLDNMAKAIIDAVKRTLFGDDRKIDHLNIIRIKSPDEEFVILNLRPTTLNEHRDVLFPRMQHSWAGAAAIDIKDYMPKGTAVSRARRKKARQRTPVNRANKSNR